MSYSWSVEVTILMPEDLKAIKILFVKGISIALFRDIIRKFFCKKHDDTRLFGTMWLFLCVPSSSTLLY